jgi:hypothetical protein
MLPDHGLSEVGLMEMPGRNVTPLYMRYVARGFTDNRAVSAEPSGRAMAHSETTLCPPE